MHNTTFDGRTSFETTTIEELVVMDGKIENKNLTWNFSLYIPKNSEIFRNGGEFDFVIGVPILITSLDGKRINYILGGLG